MKTLPTLTQPMYCGKLSNRYATLIIKQDGDQYYTGVEEYGNNIRYKPISKRLAYLMLKELPFSENKSR